MQNSSEKGKHNLWMCRRALETILHVDSDISPDLEYGRESQAERTGLLK